MKFDINAAPLETKKGVLSFIRIISRIGDARPVIVLTSVFVRFIKLHLARTAVTGPTITSIVIV